MLQGASTWDLQTMHPPLSPGFRLYLLFLFVGCLLAAANLAKLWRAAPPFRLARQERNSAYVRMLEVSSSSLRQWITCTFLAWGILASVGLYDLSKRLLAERAAEHTIILFAIEGFSVEFTMALFVVLYLVLIRWHILKRIEQVRKHEIEVP